MADQNSDSWNRLTSWLRLVEGLHGLVEPSSQLFQQGRKL